MLQMTRSCRRAMLPVCMCILTFLASTAFSQSWNFDGNDRDVPNRIVVKLKADKDIPAPHRGREVDATGIEAFDATTRRLAAKSQRMLFPTEAARNHPRSLKNILVLTFPDGADIDKILAEYRALDDVVYAYPDYKVELYEAPNDSLYVHQWYLNNTGQPHYEVMRLPGDSNDYVYLKSGTPDADIDFQEVHDNPPDNTTTAIVAVIDTGVDLDHPDLAEHIYVNPGEIPGNGIDDDHNGYVDDVHGWDVAGEMPSLIPDNDPTDEMGHGTHCAGIIGSVADNGRGVAGVAADCRILPVCIYPGVALSMLAEAVVYAADMGVDVISMSIGVPYQTEVLDDAVAYAVSRRVIFCAAAGNDGVEGVNYPAGCPGVMAIGATDSDDLLTVFSTFGNHLSVCAPGYGILSLRADNLDLYADHYEPGVHIVDSMYYIASGTSMSCPMVAGVAAYLRSVSPGLTPEATREIIEQTADDMLDPYGTGENFPGFDIYTGWGRVNLARALAAAPQVRAYINAPMRLQMLTGSVEIVGTADGAEFTNYVLDYGEGSVPESWTTIATSADPVTDDVLATWNAGALTGLYTIRLRVGETNESRVTVFAVNDHVVEIESPLAQDTAKDRITFMGKAMCPDFLFWKIEYGAGLSPLTWDSVATSVLPAPGGELTTWRCGGVPEGWYTLRLSVYSTSGLEGETSLPIYVKSLFTEPLGWRTPLNGAPTRYPTYGDFDGDGHNEIAIGTTAGLYFFNPDGTPETDGVPSLPAYDFTWPIAVGNLDGDGIDDFVAVSKDQGILFGSPSSGSVFEISLPEAPGYRGGVFLKDINGDGLDEIHYTAGFLADPVPTYMFAHDGSPWPCAFPMAYSRDACIPADLDGNGICEIYACADDTLKQLDTCGQLVAYFVFDGEGEFKIQEISAVDIDGDHFTEIVVMGFRQLDMWNFATNQLVYVFDEGLMLFPGWPHDTGLNPSFTSIQNAYFADLDNDGLLEYLGISGRSIYAWNLDGTPFAGTSELFGSPPQMRVCGSPLLIDANGDGYTEIGLSLKPGDQISSTYDGQGVGVWNRSGGLVPGWPIDVAFDLGNYSDYPGDAMFGDLDQNGLVDMVSATLADDLVFTEFPDAPYLPGRFVAPFAGYNRSRNYTYIPAHADCGDPSGDGEIDIGDAVYIIGYIFKQGAPPVPECVGDVDGNIAVDIGDVVYLVNYIFKSGPPPTPDCCP